MCTSKLKYYYTIKIIESWLNNKNKNLKHDFAPRRYTSFNLYLIVVLISSSLRNLNFIFIIIATAQLLYFKTDMSLIVILSRLAYFQHNKKRPQDFVLSHLCDIWVEQKTKQKNEDNNCDFDSFYFFFSLRFIYSLFY